MNRARWEAEAMATRLGWRGGLAGELERRARDRRNARLAAEWEGEEKRRNAGRRQGESVQ